MRKFKVSFEVETDDKGFIAAMANPNRLTARRPIGESIIYPTAVIPDTATIEEIKPPLRDGYYYSTGNLYRRASGVWSWRRVSGGWDAPNSRVLDSHHRDDFYIGPLRDECDD